MTVPSHLRFFWTKLASRTVCPSTSRRCYRGFRSSPAVFVPPSSGADGDGGVDASERETSLSEVERLFQLQRSNERNVASTNAEERKAKLQRLHDVFLSHRQDIRDAVYGDKGQCPSEVDLSDVYAVTHEIKHVRRHLKGWMKPKRVSTPLAFSGARSWIHHEPKGLALVISPWNFPFTLSFGPLISSVAAGNCTIIKPSEMSPRCSAVIKKIVENTFDENEVAVVEGAVNTSSALLEQPFHHVFFTGSPQLGKVIMAAASKHLASVTLELGGKSPVIVDETANLDRAARRLVWSKTLNCGQICIAPDYVFVHESRRDDFLRKYGENVRTLFGKDVQASGDYTRIINERHHRRLCDVLDEAVKNGAKVEIGGNHDASENYMEPTVLTNPDLNSKIMTDEIFGPLLPVITFQSLDEPIALINSKEKPLALYIYSENGANAQHIIDNTRAGATVINHSLVHYFNGNLPFGGVNNSGIGKSHGYHGFREFSNERGITKQWAPISGVELMMAPYSAMKQILIDLTIKYF